MTFRKVAPKPGFTHPRLILQSVRKISPAVWLSAGQNSVLTNIMTFTNELTVADISLFLLQCIDYKTDVKIEHCKLLANTDYYNLLNLI